MTDGRPPVGEPPKHEVEVAGDVKEAAAPAPAPKSLLARLFGKDKNGKDTADAAEKPPSVPFFKLFRFTTPVEKLMMAFGCLCAVAHGAMLPLWTIVFGSVINSFATPNPNNEKLVKDVGGLAKWFVILAVIAFIVSFFQVRMQMVVAQRASSRIRTLYFRSLMRQDFEWYDSESSGELTTRVSSDVDLIQAGIGDKVGSAVQFVSSFVAGFLIAFVYSWQLTLVILSVAPLLAVCGVLFAKSATESVGEGQTAYGAAGSIASEVLSLIKTVSAFGGQEEEARRYEKQLDSAYKRGVKKSLVTGVGYGITFFIIFCIYGYAFDSNHHCRVLVGCARSRRESLHYRDLTLVNLNSLIHVVFGPSDSVSGLPLDSFAKERLPSQTYLSLSSRS
jgi:ATP-binding cassette, subfamily B (MDR/TAP), member 1